MSGFLKEMESNLDVFNISQGEIIELFKFNSDVYDTFIRMLNSANRVYGQQCELHKKRLDDFEKITLKKDKSGKCYMEIIGADNHTRLIIRQNDATEEDYYGITGTKVTEAVLANEMDYVQKQKLKNANISSRFLKEEPSPINLYEEMDGKKLIEYYRYLNDYLNVNTTIEEYNEPENITGPVARIFEPTTPRVHPVVDYIVRKEALMKQNPKEVIKFKGNKTGREYDTYIYERDGFTLAIAEPISGVEYQYNLNLGQVDRSDSTLIREMVRSALEAEEKVVMLDDAIIRKNHTTMNVFNENLDVFLNNAHSSKPFKNKVENAKAVYK